MPSMKEQIQLPLKPAPGQVDSLMTPPSNYANLQTPNESKVIDGLDPAAEEIVWEQESERMKITTTVPENFQKILGGNWKTQEGDLKKEPDVERAASCCAPAALEKIKEDIEKAEVKCLRRLKVPRTRLVPLIREAAKYYPASSIQLSGMFLYPADGGFMGWHTNSDAPCTRVYLTHVKEGEKSFFRYRMGGEYVTSWDKAGWNMRQFDVSPDGWECRHIDPLWHCVYAEEERMSVGFRINKNLL